MYTILFVIVTLLLVILIITAEVALICYICRGRREIVAEERELERDTPKRDLFEEYEFLNTEPIHRIQS